MHVKIGENAKKGKKWGICSMNRALKLPASFDLALDMGWVVFSGQKQSNRYQLGRRASLTDALRT